MFPLYACRIPSSSSSVHQYAKIFELFNGVDDDETCPCPKNVQGNVFDKLRGLLRLVLPNILLMLFPRFQANFQKCHYSFCTRGKWQKYTFFPMRGGKKQRRGEKTNIKRANGTNNATQTADRNAGALSVVDKAREKLDKFHNTPVSTLTSRRTAAEEKIGHCVVDVFLFRRRERFACKFTSGKIIMITSLAGMLPRLNKTVDGSSGKNDSLSMDNSGCHKCVRQFLNVARFTLTDSVYVLRGA